MKLRLLVTLALTCVVALAVSAGAQAGGATVMHFAVTYPGGLATCSGNRIQHTTGGKMFIKDVENCLLTQLSVFNPAPPGNWDVNSPVIGGWCSDVDGFIFNSATCNLATSGHVTVVDNGDRTVRWHIVAYYAQP